MSLSETRELLQVLVEIDSILKGITVSTDKIQRQTPNIRENLHAFRELERLALRYLTIARKAGLPEDVQKATQLLSEFIVILRMAQMAMNMFMAGTPYGWLMGIAGTILTFFAVSDLTQSIGE